MKVQVTIFPRKEVRDPQGEAVLDKVQRLAWLNTHVQHVSVGKIILLDIAEEDSNLATAQVTRMCQEFLANDIVEDFEIECLTEWAHERSSHPVPRKQL